MVILGSLLQSCLILTTKQPLHPLEAVRDMRMDTDMEEALGAAGRRETADSSSQRKNPALRRLILRLRWPF